MHTTPLKIGTGMHYYDAILSFPVITHFPVGCNHSLFRSRFTTVPWLVRYMFFFYLILNDFLCIMQAFISHIFRLLNPYYPLNPSPSSLLPTLLLYIDSSLPLDNPISTRYSSIDNALSITAMEYLNLISVLR